MKIVSSLERQRIKQATNASNTVFGVRVGNFYCNSFYQKNATDEHLTKDMHAPRDTTLSMKECLSVDFEVS